MTIKAIETRYAGCRFRSRLEARWAVFFDALEVAWEYEPEGFELPSGRYLPDFLLHGLGGDAWNQDRPGDCWFEVKPDVVKLEDGADRVWCELAEGTGRPLIVAHGMPRPDGDLIYGSANGNGWMELYGPYWDNFRAFCFCSGCGQLGITFEARTDRICIPCPRKSPSWPRWPDHPRIIAAYAKARSARFEHGGSG